MTHQMTTIASPVELDELLTGRIVYANAPVVDDNGILLEVTHFPIDRDVALAMLSTVDESSERTLTAIWDTESVYLEIGAE